MQAHKREIWADVAKGLAIVFVVYGHAYRGLREANLLSDSPAWAIVDYVIYTTHMPVFFFITGYFFDASIRKGGRKFWSGRLAVLVWPYLLWSFLQFQAQLLGVLLLRQPERAAPVDPQSAFRPGCREGGGDGWPFGRQRLAVEPEPDIGPFLAHLQQEGVMLDEQQVIEDVGYLQSHRLHQFPEQAERPVGDMHGVLLAGSELNRPDG